MTQISTRRIASWPVRWAAATGLAVATAMALAPGATAKQNPVGGGTTTLQIKKSAASLLADGGAKIKAIDPATEKKKGYKLPITKGNLNPEKPQGKLRNDGGLQLSGSGETFKLTSFTAKLGKGAKLSAKVGRKSMKLFTLDTDNAKVQTKDGTTRVSRVKAITTSKGASLIEDVTGEVLEDPEIVFAKLRIKAEAGDVKIRSGKAKLVPDASINGILAALGVGSSAIDPGVKGPGGNFKLPIRKGKVGADGKSGIVRLNGGIEYARGGSSVGLAKPNVNLADGEISAVVAGNRGPVLSFDTDTPEVEVKGKKVDVSGIDAVLTSEGATALNEAFGTTAFATGAAYGTLEVKGKTKAESGDGEGE